MKSNSTGRSIARARSAMNMNAPLSTPTSSGRSPGVVRGDLACRARRCAPAARRSDTTTRRCAGSIVDELDTGRPCWASTLADDAGCGGGTSRRRPADAGHPPAAADLGGAPLAAGPRRAPARRWRRRAGAPPVSTGAATRGRRPGRAAGGAAAERPTASVASSCAAARVEHVGRVARAGRPGGPAPAPRRGRRRRRAAAAPRGARGCGGTRGRRCAGRRPASSPSAAQSASRLGPAQGEERTALVGGPWRPARRGRRRAAG